MEPSGTRQEGRDQPQEYYQALSGNFGSTPKSEQLLQSDMVLVHFNSSKGFLQEI